MEPFSALSEQRASILFVDDEQDVLDVLVQSFRNDYEVLSAESGEAALRIMEERSVDLVVTDQRMPNMTGIELIKKARERLPDLTTIILTAYTDPPALIDAINTGEIYRFVTKPWNLPDLTQTIASAIERVRLRRENTTLHASAQRRLAALDVLYDVSRGTANYNSYPEIVDRVTALLERVVPYDICGALIAGRGDMRSSLSLRIRRPVTPQVLESFKYELLERYAALTSERYDDKQLLVRVAGSSSSEHRAQELIRRVFIPLHAEGRPTGMLAVASANEGSITPEDEKVLDILANQTAEVIYAFRDKLGAEQRRLRTILDLLDDAVLMTDPTGKILVANSAALKLIPADCEQGSGGLLQEFMEFDPFILARRWEREGAAAANTEAVIGTAVRQVSVSPILETDGQLGGTLVTIRERVEDAAGKSGVPPVSLVSHELRTPLTSISGTLELLLSGKAGELDQGQKRYIKRAKESTDELRDLCNNLLEYATIVDGKLVLHRRKYDLGALLSTAAERFDGSFRAKGIELFFERPPEPVHVHVDAMRLQQVLGNLLANALRYVENDGKTAVELIGDADVDGVVGFSIWNDGAPIPEEDLERIFERFSQSARNNTAKQTGVGLGLAVCRAIVEDHRGKIWAESSPSSGTRFVVTFPRSEEAGHITPSSGPVRASGLQRVLVVDDHLTSAYVLKGTLLRAGFSVDVVHDAQEALQVARRQRPDVMVVDVRMPEVNGIELINILRHDPTTEQIPILSVSAAEEERPATAAGADRFLSKPLDPAQLVFSVRELAAQPRVRVRVLVVDSDVINRTRCCDVLNEQDCVVHEAEDGTRALELLHTVSPNLVIAEVDLPDGSGFELLRAVKAPGHNKRVSAIITSSHSDTESKVKALRLGADDYLVKPFDAQELAARVDTLLARSADELAASPTTQLPGSAAIEREIDRRIRSKKPYALCYLDLDNFKAYNDYYGYARADGVIRQIGDLLREVVGRRGNADDFLGHVAGDDFVLVTSFEKSEAVTQEIVSGFDRIIPLYYCREDRDRGFIRTEDRDGKVRDFPMMGISVVVVRDSGGQYTSHAKISEAAAELKRQAKAQEGSVVVSSG